MLRTRLFLSLIPFVLLLLGVGVYAIVLFSHLAANVDLTVMDNYRSERATEAMSVALSRMETGLHLALEGETNSSVAFFRQNAPVFEDNLATLGRASKGEKQQDLIRELRINSQILAKAGDGILGMNDLREQRQLFEREVQPRLLTLNLLLEQVARENHKNALATSRRIQEINSHITRLMIIALIVATIIALSAAYHIGKMILRPIRLVTDATREVGEGNLDHIVPVLSNDELGQMATAFNKMAAQLRDYRQSTTEKIVRLHRTMDAALASFPDPIFVLDREGHIELKNPAARNLSLRLALDDKLPNGLSATANKVLRTGEDFLPHDFKDVMAFRLNDEEKAYLPRIHTMRGEDRKPVGVAVVLHDVTRFRLMDDVKSNLVATVSHELKTPLTSVRMVLYLLLEKTLGPLTRKQSEMLETARKDAERLLRILNDLLDLARLETGNSGLHKERISPAALLQRISEEAKQSVAAQGLKLSTSAQPNLPDISVDAQRIGHVFHNLVTNAIKHSPAGGEIRLSAVQSSNHRVQFSVTDQGPGVPQEFQNRIFDRFFRIPGQTKTGAGLGLSIAREIVTAHGGRIGVRTAPGGGSEFFVVLDRAAQSNGD